MDGVEVRGRGAERHDIRLVPVGNIAGGPPFEVRDYLFEKGIELPCPIPLTA